MYCYSAESIPEFSTLCSACARVCEIIYRTKCDRSLSVLLFFSLASSITYHLRSLLQEKRRKGKTFSYSKRGDSANWVGEHVPHTYTRRPLPVCLPSPLPSQYHYPSFFFFRGGALDSAKGFEFTVSSLFSSGRRTSRGTH